MCKTGCTGGSGSYCFWAGGAWCCCSSTILFSDQLLRDFQCQHVMLLHVWPFVFCVYLVCYGGFGEMRDGFIFLTFYFFFKFFVCFKRTREQIKGSSVH